MPCLLNYLCLGEKCKHLQIYIQNSHSYAMQIIIREVYHSFNDANLTIGRRFIDFHGYFTFYWNWMNLIIFQLRKRKQILRKKYKHLNTLMFLLHKISAKKIFHYLIFRLNLRIHRLPFLNFYWYNKEKSRIDSI